MSDRIEGGKGDGFKEVAGMFRNFIQTMIGGEGRDSSFNASFRAMTDPAAALKTLAESFDGKTPPTIG